MTPKVTQNGVQNRRKIELREKVRIELPPARELNFQCPDPPETGPKNHLKNDLATDPLKNTVRRALFANLGPTCRKWGPNLGPRGRPGDLFFQLFKRSWEQVAPRAPQEAPTGAPKPPKSSFLVILELFFNDFCNGQF